MEEQNANQLIKIERDENFLVKNINYKFTPDGLVDWRSMVPVNFLYLNNDPKNRERVEKLYGKPYSEIDIIKDNVKDSDLVILLGGIKYIAKLRGFESVHYIIKEANTEYVAINCRINFIGNYETEGRMIAFEDNACAHLDNTNSFAKRYLLEIATNRAFCRAVRNFLNINIVSKEELGASIEPEITPKNSLAPEKQIKMLIDIMAAKKVQWGNIVEKLKNENRYKPEYATIGDLPKDIIFEFIERLKRMPST